MPEAAVTLTTGLPPVPLVMACAMLLFLPGYAAATLLLPPPGHNAVERLLAAPALTVALLALLTLWASTLHVPLGPGASVAVLLGSLLLVGIQAFRSFIARPRSMVLLGAKPVTAIAGYLALFAVALGLRLWSTHDVLPTLGADTYHHTLVVQLLVDHGGLPDSYWPYAPIQSFAYHFGFHSLVAWLHWWTGADAGVLVGLAGHLVNAAVALAVAYFVLRLAGDGLVAALASWLLALLCVFPAYLVNWGRFTQATGLLLFPIAAALCIDARRSTLDHRAVLRSALATGLVASGLLLAHYRIAAMLPLLVGVWLLYVILCHPDSRSFRRAASTAPSFHEAAGSGFPARRMAAAPAGREALTVASSGPEARPARPPSQSNLSWSHGQDDRAPPPVNRPADSAAPGLATTRPRVPPLLARSAGLAARLGAVGLVGGLLALPWLVHLPGALSLGLGQQPGEYGADYYGLERLGSAVAQPTNPPLLALAAVGFTLAWILGRRPAAERAGVSAEALHGAVYPASSLSATAAFHGGPPAVLLLGVWALAQLALANPRWWPVPMPLAGRVDVVTTIAALCFPLAVAAALALATAWRVSRAQQGSPAVTLALVLGVGATGLGGWQLQALVTPNNVLVTPADLAAAAWLRTHTPPEAHLAVSAVIFPWAPDYVVGVDGGYWLPLLAGRATTVLPMLYPGERGADPHAVAEMVAAARALRDAPAAPQTAALLRALGVGYVYDSGRSPVPAAVGLNENPAFRLAYAEGGVRIWAVAPE